VNPADLNFIEGNYGKVAELPAVPGMEGVGA
jgi:NADPH:quinone reductase-like Zn-dependent oxidoreductase